MLQGGRVCEPLCMSSEIFCEATISETSMLSYYCCDKHYDKQFGEERVNLAYPISKQFITEGSQSRQELKPEPRGRIWSRDQGRMMFMVMLLIALSQFTSYAMQAPLPMGVTVAWTFPDQSLINEMHQRLAREPMWRRHFLNWNSLSIWVYLIEGWQKKNEPACTLL